MKTCWVLISLLCLACSSPEPVPYHERESRQALHAGNAFFARGMLDLAAERFTAALRYAESADLLAQKVAALNNLGMVALAQGEVSNAVDFFDQAWAIHAGDAESRLTAELLLNRAIAAMAASEGAPAPATGEQIERSLAICSTIEDPALELRARNARGLRWFRAGQIDAARDEWQASLEQARKLEESAAVAAALANLAAIDQREGRTADAIVKLEQALAIDKAQDDAVSIANDLALLGDAHAQQGETRRAIDHFERALAIHAKLPNARRAARDRERLAALAQSR